MLPTFFFNTLDLKKIPDRNYPGELFLVPKDSYPDDIDFEVELSLHPARYAAYILFLIKFQNLEIVGAPFPLLEHLYNSAYNLLNIVTATALAQAVVDEDISTINTLLNETPELLLYSGASLMVTSQDTLQTFSVSNILGIAAQRKQIDMMKLLMTYLTALQKTEVHHDKATAIISAGFALWPRYTKDSTSHRLFIPQIYVDLFMKIAEALKSNDSPFQYTNTLLHPKIEAAFEELYQKLNPDYEKELRKRKVTSNAFLDFEFLMYVALRVYEDQYKDFDRGHRVVFSIRVIGILEHFMPIQTKKIICKGKFNDKPLTRAAEKLLQNTNGGDLIIRRGLGFDWLITFQNYGESEPCKSDHVMHSAKFNKGFHEICGSESWEGFLKLRDAECSSMLVQAFAQTPERKSAHQFV